MTPVPPHELSLSRQENVANGTIASTQGGGLNLWEVRPENAENFFKVTIITSQQKIHGTDKFRSAAMRPRYSTLR